LTIYFVDEDSYKYDAWLEELRFRGYEVVEFTNADDAFAHLVVANDVELAIIDVMLSAAPQGSDRFTRERTDDYLETGLALLNDLVQQRDGVFPARSVLLTNTINVSTFRSARECAVAHSIELLEKSSIDSPFHFGDRVEEILDGIDSRPGLA
jgi:CheY-like chemotaxis protein